MFHLRLHYVSELSVRVREDFWRESEENRDFICRKAVFVNGDPDWPRAQTLPIMVMSTHEPTGCIHFVDPESFETSIKLQAELDKHFDNIAAMMAEIEVAK